jgi:hypothetical protein
VAYVERRLGAVNTARFIDWIEQWLVPHLRCGDFVVLDNPAVHEARRVRALIEQAGRDVAVFRVLADVKPIQAAWARIKKRIRAVAVHRHCLRTTAQRAGRVVPAPLSELVRPCWLLD